jgi:hypothetical protein
LEILVKKNEWVGMNLEDLAMKKMKKMGGYKFQRFGEVEDGKVWKWSLSMKSIEIHKLLHLTRCCSSICVSEFVDVLVSCPLFS